MKENIYNCVESNIIRNDNWDIRVYIYNGFIWVRIFFVLFMFILLVLRLCYSRCLKISVKINGR